MLRMLLPVNVKLSFDDVNKQIRTQTFSFYLEFVITFPLTLLEYMHCRLLKEGTVMIILFGVE